MIAVHGKDIIYKLQPFWGTSVNPETELGTMFVLTMCGISNYKKEVNYDK